MVYYHPEKGSCAVPGGSLGMNWFIPGLSECSRYPVSGAEACGDLETLFQLRTYVSRYT